MLSNAKAMAGDLSGFAIVATTGNDAWSTTASSSAASILGSGANTLNNDGSGRFYSGTTLNLGAGNTFTNSGLLSPGGDDVSLTTALTGNLVQAGGNYLVTLDGAQVNVNDQVDVSGTADMAGTVQVQVIDAGTRGPEPDDDHPVDRRRVRRDGTEPDRPTLGGRQFRAGVQQPAEGRPHPDRLLDARARRRPERQPGSRGRLPGGAAAAGRIEPERSSCWRPRTPVPTPRRSTS